MAVAEKVLSPSWDVTAPFGSTSEHIARLKRKAAFFTLMGYTPHRYQWELIHSRPERFMPQCWPRQHGKSMGAGNEALFCCADEPGQLVWLVAPTYDLCEPIWDVIEQAAIDKCHFPEFKPEHLSRRDMEIVWSNRTKFSCKSAENYVSLQGRGVTHLFVDEAASIADPSIWEQYLRPTIAVSRGRVIPISTPKGFNWFFDLAQKGMDPLQTDYFFGHAPLGCSPYVSREEIDEARTSLPERVFKQEWEAEFVSDAGAIFRGVKDCVVKGLTENQKPEDGRFYAAGIDLAKHEDYSVITVIDRMRKRQVYFQRFNQVDWDKQIPLFAKVLHAFGGKYCPCLIDSGGPGDPIFDFMRKLGMTVYGYDFHGDRKEDLINNLALHIEQRAIGLMDIPEQTNELIGYEYRRTKAGKLTMSAPGRQHDDCVIALALADWQATQGTGQVRTVTTGWRF
jgi:hypothetical protein